MLLKDLGNKSKLVETDDCGTKYKIRLILRGKKDMYRRNVPLWASHILSYIVLMSLPDVETHLLCVEPMALRWGS